MNIGDRIASENEKAPTGSSRGEGEDGDTITELRDEQTTYSKTLSRGKMPSSAVTILSLLDAYSQIHEQAETEQRACVWQLTKARHSKGRGGALVNGILNGNDIREDLSARKVLKTSSSSSQKKNNDEEGEEELPSLSNEDDDTSTTTKVKQHTSCHFVLVDTLEEESQKQKQQQETNNKENAAASSNSGMGLRRRKGANETTTSNNAETEWTVEEEEQYDEEQDRLRKSKSNPIDFFGGLPPKELRKAQQEANKMLVSYIQAANLLVALQTELDRS